MQDSGTKKKVILYICITAFLFSTMEVSLKIGGSNLDSMQLTFLRFFIGGLVLLPAGIVEAKKNELKMTLKDLGWLLLVGIMGIPISMYAFQVGVSMCNASTAAAIICVNSIFTMIIAAIFTEEKMNKNKYIAAVLGIIATVFMMRPWDVQEGNTVTGMLMMLFASITFGAYTVMGRKSIGKIGTFTQTSLSFILGSLVLLVEILITGGPVLEGIVENWAIVLYTGIVVTGIGYMFYFMAIKLSDATTGSVTFLIKPVLAPILAMFVLGEDIYWNTIVGIFLLLVASFLVLKSE